MSTPALRWGILSTGKIAHSFAASLAPSSTGRLVAVASRNKNTAEQFAGEHNVPHAHADYASLLENPEVEAVYIAPPHPFHKEWAIRAASAGKHILCEKPAGMNRDEVSAIIEAARQANVFFMEAFMYRCHPQTATLRQLIRSGEIGTLRMIHASFSGHCGEYDLRDRLIARRLGGGSILDIGCYGVSLARLLAGEAQGKRFAEPLSMRGLAKLEPTEQVDLTAAAILSFDGELLAMIQSGLQLQGENRVRIEGDKGHIIVNSPWFAGADGASITIHHHKSGTTTTIDTATPGKDLYSFEIDEVARAVSAGEKESPQMSWEDSLGNAAVLDTWLAEAGVSYPAK